eukprot:789858_1
MSSSSSGIWCCAVCTFENANSIGLVCEMCGTAREDVKPQHLSSVFPGSDKMQKKRKLMKLADVMSSNSKKKKQKRSITDFSGVVLHQKKEKKKEPDSYSESAASNSGIEWSCKRCTLLNQSTATACIACSEQRKEGNVSGMKSPSSNVSGMQSPPSNVSGMNSSPNNDSGIQSSSSNGSGMKSSSSNGSGMKSLSSNSSGMKSPPSNGSGIESSSSNSSGIHLSSTSSSVFQRPNLSSNGTEFVRKIQSSQSDTIRSTQIRSSSSSRVQSGSGNEMKSPDSTGLQSVSSTGLQSVSSTGLQSVSSNEMKSVSSTGLQSASEMQSNSNQQSSLNSSSGDKSKKQEALKPDQNIPTTSNSSSESTSSSRNSTDSSPLSKDCSAPDFLKRFRRKHPIASSSTASQSSSSSSSTATGVIQGTRSSSEELLFLTWNVWFKEEVALRERIAAIGECVKRHRPHVIAFQEVTVNILHLMWSSDWFKEYKCSVPTTRILPTYFVMILSRLPLRGSPNVNKFACSQMQRELVQCQIDLRGFKVTVATTHLESPVNKFMGGKDDLFTGERKTQIKESFKILDKQPLVVFGGDMNWNDNPKRKRNDGPVPLPSGWTDCWLTKHPNSAGFTYDGRANQMLANYLQSRLDRVFVKGIEVESVKMIGTEAIPGVTYEKKSRKTVKTLPVYPSDHFGLLCKLKVNRS